MLASSNSNGAVVSSANSIETEHIARDDASPCDERGRRYAKRGVVRPDRRSGPVMLRRVGQTLQHIHECFGTNMSTTGATDAAVESPRNGLHADFVGPRSAAGAASARRRAKCSGGPPSRLTPLRRDRLRAKDLAGLPRRSSPEGRAKCLKWRSAFAAAPLRRDRLRVKETRLACQDEARRRRAKDGGGGGSRTRVREISRRRTLHA